MMYYAGVGSRETPGDVLVLMSRLARFLQTYDCCLRSGHAEGADFAFEQGVGDHPQHRQIFLPYDGFNGGMHDPEQGYYDVNRYSQLIPHAQALAKRARGNFYGLGRNGIAYHTRNAFQVLGPNLDDPVKGIFYWAIPVGRQEKCKGGTNTALQLAILHGVTKRYNLYYDEVKFHLVQRLNELGG